MYKLYLRTIPGWNVLYALRNEVTFAFGGLNLC